MLSLNKSHTPVESAKLQESGCAHTPPVCALSETKTGGLASLHSGSRAVINPCSLWHCCSTTGLLFHLNTCELLKGDCRSGTLAWPSLQSPHAAREAILAANTELHPLAGKHRNPNHQTSWLEKNRIMWSYNKLKPQKLTGNLTWTTKSLRY